MRQGTPTKLIWAGVSGVSFVLLVILSRLGYGSLDSNLALHKWPLLLAYVPLAFSGGFGITQLIGLRAREGALPFARGLYLFPAALVDARSDQFKVYDTKDLASVTPQGAGVAIAFQGGKTFVLPVSGDATQMVATIQSARDRAMRAVATEDPKELVAVDPLHDPIFSSPVGPQDPYDIRRPPWGKFGWVAALLFGAILGISLWFMRNARSDQTLYARATQANDTVSYKEYLAHGKASKDQVSNFLLPRAELRDAIRVGTVDALLRYRAEHQNSKIADEVSAALRAAMLRELEKAKGVGTLAALHEFARRYPQHGIDPELRAAIHAVYARELDAYRKRTPNKDKNVLPFVERLFAWAEKQGPKVEIRFRRKKSETIGRGDQFVAKTPYFNGEVSYPSRYFDEKRSAKREQTLAETLATKLDAGLSPELLDISMGAAVTDETLPEVKVPTLFIIYTAEWSGHSYPVPKPRGTFVGITFPFEVQFVIPADTKPLKYKTDIFKMPPFALLKDDDGPMPPGAAEEKLYSAMGTTAFEVFGDKVLSLFFVKEK